MAIPLSAIRKYTPEIIALSFVAIVLGAFWSIIDTYQPPYLLDLRPEHALNTTNASEPAIMNVTVPVPSELTIHDQTNSGAVKNGTAPNIPNSPNQSDDDFAISAQKVIKFALTGESNEFLLFFSPFLKCN